MQFIVNAEPRGKMRPKFSTKGGFARGYQSKKDKEWENSIRKAFLNAGGEKIDGFCSINIKATFRIPKSYSKKKKEQIINHNEPFLKTPDVDNIMKSVLDALNGVAYDDDKQVVMAKCSKSYALDENPHLEVLIYENDTFL